MFDHVVIGAGITGACTAWVLARAGARVALLDRFPAGHARGSSHGSSRIARTSYHDPLFSRMMIRAHAEDWPALAADLGTQVIHPRPGLFFGPPGPAFERHREAAASSGSEVREVDPRSLAFPQFEFDGMRVLLDPTAGVIAAARVQAGLRAWLEAHCTVRTCPVLALDREAVAVFTDAGRIHAGSIVVCAGPWILAFIARRFRGEAKLVAVERCFYTNTSDEDFVLDMLPDQPRIAIGSACSGHGFKFGPLSGRILASLLGVGEPIPEYAAARSRFALRG